jgi:phosphatidylserine/phosphatidylglycerophosphate/cardiolipin synthase-like enzyme
VETHIGIGVGKFIETEFQLAKEYIWISSPVISPNIGKKIFALTEKGIKTRIITSDKITQDSDITNQLAKKLLSKNNEKKLKPFQLDYKVVSRKEIPIIHSKIYIIDGKCAIIGSVNLTENHFWNYAEYIWILREPELIEKVKEDYEKLWNSCNYGEIEMPGTKKELKDKVRNFRRKIDSKIITKKK